MGGWGELGESLGVGTHRERRSCAGSSGKLTGAKAEPPRTPGPPGSRAWSGERGFSQEVQPVRKRGENRGSPATRREEGKEGSRETGRGLSLRQRWCVSPGPAAAPGAIPRASDSDLRALTGMGPHNLCLNSSLSSTVL